MYSVGIFELRRNLCPDNALQFNPIQIAEWLRDLLDSGVAHSQRALEDEDELGIDRTQVGQFLDLLRLPPEYLSQLKSTPGPTEYQLRPVVVMAPKHQVQAIRTLLSRSTRSAV